ncbi:GNAT family N-acetyltransferase [Qipengyuania qiaonensis]|uniref:GNAT family N-acetyltransferase n=1 Tax=Qipengyuania qiaonensis TaxID=2867240 RepID=A0ABS7J573_9SPHN|nr:GNAT family N-acetyltransferase [Qipengyuania qiaonensis]
MAPSTNTENLALRPLREEELDQASRLCLRSKAYWGHDAQFLSRCEAELILTRNDLRRGDVIAATGGDLLLGIAQIGYDGEKCFLEKLFVDPEAMGVGTGRKLFEWAVTTAREKGVAELIVEADPGAVTFYLKMGCKRAGSVPSGSIPGRTLPRLVFDMG